MSQIRETLKKSMKEAMIAKQSDRLTIIRMILAKIKDADIAGRTKGLENGISDSDILSLLQNMIKQRVESARMYTEGNRPELAETENMEIAIITEYLPEQLSQDEIAKIVTDTIAQMDASSMADMGKVMGQIKSKYAGTLDMGLASKLIKDALS